MNSQRRAKMPYCRATESQYTVRQEVYCVTIPERRRARRMPSMRPVVTIERAKARRLGGARSPTRGIMSWGVTVVTAVMN